MVPNRPYDQKSEATKSLASDFGLFFVSVTEKPPFHVLFNLSKEAWCKSQTVRMEAEVFVEVKNWKLFLFSFYFPIFT